MTGQVLTMNSTGTGTLWINSNTTATAPHSWSVGRSMSMSVDEFMEIEDGDMKKRMYSHNEISTEFVAKKIDNEGKVAYYYIQRNVKLNNKGVFYVQNSLSEWISYNKTTKKVKVSKHTPNVLKMMLKEHFGSNWEIMERFIRRTTSTLCKKIIEGKITCLRNIMEYHRSYTIRRKVLDVITILRFIVRGELYILHSIEDPENFYSFDKLMNIDSSFWTIKPFTFKSEEIDNVGKRYKEWIDEQDKKLDTFRRLRDGKIGSSDVQDPEL